MNPQDLVRLLEEGPKAVKVTALHPGTGKTNPLSVQQLRELLEAIASPDAPRRIESMGLPSSWLEGFGIQGVLFLAEGKGRQRSGKSLRELLDVVREEAGLAGPRPQDKLVHIVEDDESIRGMYDFILRKSGFRTDIFSDGDEFLRELRTRGEEGAADLLILDLMLPGRSGFEVLRDLQAEAPRMKVLIVTGRFMDSGTVNILRCEPNTAEFLSKPVPAQSLILAVQRALGVSAAALAPI
jgi:CheY-like chemotaxis protein